MKGKAKNPEIRPVPSAHGAGGSHSQSSCNFVIVGSGLTGLNLARELKNSDPNLTVSILEKSTSCGGRMATRRVGDLKFDHGAQFIKKTDASQLLIEYWNSENVATRFPSKEIEAVCGLAGISQLAKKLAVNLDVTYNFEATRLDPVDDGWIVHSEDGRSRQAKTVVLTSPLPQALELLSGSNVHYDSRLGALSYAKCIVLLIQSEFEILSNQSYFERIDEDVFSACSQRAKGLAPTGAWTIAMSEAWSERHFDRTEDAILNSARPILQKKFGLAHPYTAQVKKWRYSHPQETWPQPFDNPQPGLFVAGDGFGGPSLVGALMSSNGLLKHLQKTLAPQGDGEFHK